MAEEQSIFTEKASAKLHSPDDLENYVRVTNPSVWIVLAACVTLLIGFFAWGIFGTAATSVGTTGTLVNGEVVCFLSEQEVTKVHVGDPAKVGEEQLYVRTLSTVPMSRAEAREIIGSDYLTNSLMKDDWTYAVYLSGDGGYTFGEGVPLSVTITTERIAPITLVFGGDA